MHDRAGGRNQVTRINEVPHVGCAPTDESAVGIDSISTVRQDRKTFVAESLNESLEREREGEAGAASSVSDEAGDNLLRGVFNNFRIPVMDGDNFCQILVWNSGKGSKKTREVLMAIVPQHETYMMAKSH